MLAFCLGKVPALRWAKAGATFHVKRRVKKATFSTEQQQATPIKDASAGRARPGSSRVRPVALACLPDRYTCLFLSYQGYHLSTGRVKQEHEQGYQGIIL